MQEKNDLILKEFKDIVIYKTINDPQEIFESVVNPFRAKKLVHTLWSDCFKLFLYTFVYNTTFYNYH